MSRIAVVGMACEYPDASSPEELWANIIAGRRAFRRIPEVRMSLDDYWDADPSVPDRFYARNAAVLKDYEFDRLAYRIAGSTYRSTDLTHWLALDTAGRALADAGYPMAEGLPRERTSVVVGNSLTGEFSRANLMRLRWPFVRRTVGAALRGHGWSDGELGPFLADLENSYKAPFPAIDEDTLAGALANTIAGRVCNYFDLGGGGYTVDGACSSSLLAVATSCRSLLNGETDVAVAGGVDLSIDPFELIGFAKTGALATGEMRVYDEHSNGFWPGEGCGMVVLMREEDALRQGRPVQAVIAGWGISSDGKGGITRPTVSGYRKMLERAYERSGFGIETVGLFEGHGTGTKVGDEVELTALSGAREDAGAGSPVAMGTVKGIIGHTKAAAGIAGFIKASMALREQVLPPTTGCFDPHPLLARQVGGLRALTAAEPWPEDVALRAGVTAMGFGGINSHIVLEGAENRRRRIAPARTRTLPGAQPDCEVLLVEAESAEALGRRLAELAEWVGQSSFAELGDTSIELHRRLTGKTFRAAVVASSPEEAARRLRRLADAVEAGETKVFGSGGREFLAASRPGARVGLLFPGQGAGGTGKGGRLRRLLPEVDAVYAEADLPQTGDLKATELAQPRIVTGSLAALQALSAFRVEAHVAVGHSLGELSALYWAGALEADQLLRLAGIRGQVMAQEGEPGGMAGIGADADTTRSLIAGLPLSVAGYNGPTQTVVSGAPEAIEDVVAAAAAQHVTATRLRVSHAFHSPLVKTAADSFVTPLAREEFGTVVRRVVSTVTGQTLDAGVDLRALLHRQITDPVLFAPALEIAARDVDVFVEVGPGGTLTALAREVVDVPTVSLDPDSQSCAGLMGVLAATFVVGAAVSFDRLFTGRPGKPVDIGSAFDFLSSPTSFTPGELDLPSVIPAPAPTGTAPAPSPAEAGTSVLEMLRGMVAERAEMPPELVSDDSHLLDDLHLSSITVGQLVNQAGQMMGTVVAQPPTNMATATLRELAELMEGLATGGAEPVREVVAGAAGWARCYSVEPEAAPPVAAIRPGPDGPWELFGPDSAFATGLAVQLRTAGVGAGTLVCLPAEVSLADVDLALAAAKAALAGGPGTGFLLVQHGDHGAAGLARSLHLEAPDLDVTIVHCPPDPGLVAQVLAEVGATRGFAEVHLDGTGARRVPTMRIMPVRADVEDDPLSPGDVVLVTGGGKGITAECALTLARASGARLALLGRSDPADDVELARNLERFAAAGVEARYLRADVSDPVAVARVVATVQEQLGPVVGLLHGAGRNEPAGVAGLDARSFRDTFAPKVDGLVATLAALDVDALKLLVTFGSIIGRAGLHGEGHYATANEWLAARTARFAAEHPDCRTRCMEWSVWSGVGMGERLSVVETLARDGISAVTTDDGLKIMMRLVRDPKAPPVVLVSGRTGAVDTLHEPDRALPLGRFLERTLLRHDGAELITEIELSAGTDHYLTDHELDGNLILPAVFGLEGMAQVAAAVLGRDDVPVFEGAEFLRPVVVAPNGTTTIRIAAAVVDDGVAQVVLRASDTGFAADHFRAVLRFGDSTVEPGEPLEVPRSVPDVALAPHRDLYGDVLFQGPRFQRLVRYHRSSAKHADADLEIRDVDWFAGYLPGGLMLGDPGVRDALMHGNQVCVPDATLLPVGVARLVPGLARTTGPGLLRYCASERSHVGDDYFYDVVLRTGDGTAVERWEGLHLRAVRRGVDAGPWAPVLVGSILERGLDDLLGAHVSVVVEPHGPEDEPARRREHTARALGRALGRGPVEVHYRPDGRPYLDGGPAVSAAHLPGLTLAVSGIGRLACDIEPAVARPADEWKGLLAQHHALARFLATDRDESIDVAGTRVWAATECLRKAGLPGDAPLSHSGAPAPGWTMLRSGSSRIATLVTALRGFADPIVLAVLVEGDGTDA